MKKIGILNDENTEFSLRDLVVEAVERVNPIAMKKNLTLHTEYDESKPFIVRVDRNKLLQALINVVSNGHTLCESGLGLAISKAIVERCGGSITADNRVEGGAMFTIGLPSVPTKD